MELEATTWKGLAVAAGHIAGLFDALSPDSPISVPDLAKRKGYDLDKVRKWATFAAGVGIVEEKDGKLTLSPKGRLFSAATGIKDVLAFIEETSYFAKAAAAADATFKQNQSLDKLSDGKISKDYQPKVSDNLSAVLIERFKAQGMAPGDHVLDVGCGAGAFIRSLYKEMPDLYFSGIDINLFAIEKGKKENMALGMADKIKMIVGDMLEDLSAFPDESEDWVLAINVLHFTPEDKRNGLIENLVRIARKGAIFNTVRLDTSLINLAGDPLLHLLWNDYAGFYSKKALDALMADLPKRYHRHEIQTEPVMQGNSQLISVLKRRG
jgi:ubiquinone/menaquinone biosynthesis C-methylase UbiE